MAPNYNSPEIQSRFGYRSTAEDVTAGLSLDGQTVLVTGCNTGLGYETMRVLALRGAQVIGTARSEESANRACASVPGNAIGISCELTNPLAIRACATAIRSREPRIDAIICNAGIMALPKLELVRGYEAQFFVNHVAHFILVTELLDALADHGRVLVLTSVAHWLAPRGGIEFDNLSGQRSYKSLRAYGQSKLANILFAKELARRLAGTTKTANAVHPGVIPGTNLLRHMKLPQVAQTIGAKVLTPLIFKTVPQGAATTCFVAANPAARAVSGEYLADCRIGRPRSDANDRELAKRLWDFSAQINANV
jgi:WW domain-containing oxidoreductase